MKTSDFKEMQIDEAFRALDSSRHGLTREEAQERLGKYGYNEIKEKKKNTALLFLSKFYGPIPILLWIVIVLTYILRHFAELYVVLALLVFNALVSFAEEYKADMSMDLLKQRLSVNARVLRSNEWHIIEAKYLVPGDVVRLRAGDIVPADVKVIEQEGLESNESVLTGESMPVQKGDGSIVYASSTVTRGEATCLVVGTGADTYFGKTAELVNTARPKLHLEETIMSIVKYLVAADIVAVAVMFIYGFFYLHTGALVLIPFLLIVIIASVPVALPAAFTVSMAYGTEKLAKKHVLVTKLEALEETSNMSILCLDKTGTLTENKIVVEGLSAFGFSDQELVEYAALASRAEDKDPIDIAVLDYASSLKIKPYRQLSFKPFDPETKRTEAVISDGKKRYAVTKGAVQVIAKLCGLRGSAMSKAESIIDGYSSRGLRSIAVAINKGKSWRFVGIIALADELRPDSKALISELKDMHVEPKLLTGDNAAVARQIAEQVGIGSNVVDAEEFEKLDIKRAAKEASCFAGIYPTDKFAIVKALQGENEIVGMTGDGVNDAPALKQAEVGIAVENATDVAKSAADLVLLKSGIAVIIEAIKESRRIFERMLTYTMAKIAKVMQIVGFILIAYLIFGFVPILPIQLLLLIFTNDIANISLSTDNAPYSKSPTSWMVRPIINSSLMFGALLALEAFAIFAAGKYVLLQNVAELQTSIFVALVVTDKLAIFNIRTREKAFWKEKPSAALVIAAGSGIVAGALLAYYGVLMQSISAVALLYIFAIAIAFFFATEFAKKWIFKILYASRQTGKYF
ncbi:MAG: plasma-membrane proton-efflux P-type ATPase [Candidatus Micrarchaeaceae archaeon]